MRESEYINAVYKVIEGAAASGSGGWHKGECPACNRKRALAFHFKHGFKCFGCHIGGSKEEFVEFLDSCGLEHGIVLETQHREGSNLADEMRELFEFDEAPKMQGTVNIELPPGVVKIRTRAPKYLTETRDFPKGFILGLNIYMAADGLYWGHIIFPMITGRQRAWLAYRCFEHPTRPKTLTPKGSTMSEFLWPWHLAPVGGKVVIVEGVMDAMRALLHFRSGSGYFPLAILGSKVSRAHLRAVEALEPTEVAVCLDADTNPKVWTSKEKPPPTTEAVERFSLRFSRVSVVLLSEYDGINDPDDVRSCDTWMEMLNAKKPMLEALI